MVVDGSGNVGIGTASPSDYNDSADGLVVTEVFILLMLPVEEVLTQVQYSTTTEQISFSSVLLEPTTE